MADTPDYIAMDVDKGFRLRADVQPNGDYRLLLVLVEKALEQALEMDPDFVAPSGPTLLAEYDADTEVLTTYPTTLNFGPYFLKPKYHQIRKIAFEGVDPLEHLRVPDVDFFYEEFPTGVIKSPLAGLGLAHDMRFIVHAIERQGPYDELAFIQDKEISTLGTAFLLPYKVFDSFRRAINRTHTGALGVANRAKAEYLDVNLKLATDPDFKWPEGDGTGPTLAEILVDKLTGKARKPADISAAAVKTVRKSMKAMAEADPIELMELHREIELVTLEELIDRIAKKIEQPTLTETHWQEFLTANAFVLQLAFNLPAVIFDEQVAVGGTRFDGRGGKLADYVMRLGGLGNLAIIEIKRPKTELVESRQYREGLHAPTRELAGAVSQVLDQRHKLQLEINNKKMASEIFDIFTYAVPCIVIAGLMPKERTEQKSFELYRHNQRDVVVITFDELLAKLRSLLDFLKNPPEAMTPGEIILEDDPF